MTSKAKKSRKKPAKPYTAGAFVRAHRRKAGLRQAAIAVKARYSERYVRALELGRRLLTDMAIYSLASALALPPSDSLFVPPTGQDMGRHPVTTVYVPRAIKPAPRTIAQLGRKKSRRDHATESRGLCRSASNACTT